MTQSIHQRLAALTPEYGRARITAGADALVRARTQAPAVAELPADEQRYWLRDAQAVLDAAGLPTLMRDLSKSRRAEALATRHALLAEREVAELSGRLADRESQIADLNTREARRIVEVHDLETRVAEAEALVGETGQPGWDGVDRAEAIRQADRFHGEMLRWAAMHDERRLERDIALDLLRRLVDASTDEDAAPELLSGVLAEARAELAGRPKPQAGDRLVDGGQMGTLITCHTCSGLGLLHQLDVPPAPGPEPTPEPQPQPAADLADSPFEDPEHPCAGCGCPRKYHDDRVSHCTGDFLHCRCTGYVPAGADR